MNNQASELSDSDVYDGLGQSQLERDMQAEEAKRQENLSQQFAVNK